MSVKDTRIVEMQFENKNFEKNISTSQKSLERFKKELDFDEASKGLVHFSNALSQIDFLGVANNIQRLTDKFTGLGTVGEFVLSRLRRKLEELGDEAIRFTKSMTIDLIDAGKAKYEELNRSVQTIMSATGEAETTVYKTLERLNKYTDQTSYSFSDMASNIGKFTSVGISLEDAEKQMEGIANWAARSGANIQEASRAMYNLSQAMGQGSLKMIDWKSIVNAGMATKEFKEQMIDAGVAAGTLERVVTKGADGVETTVVKTAKRLGKQVEVTYQNFEQSLSTGWANTQVIGDTLMRYYYLDLEETNREFMVELTDEQKKMFGEIFKSTSKLDKKAWDRIAEAGLGTEAAKKALLDVAEANGLLTTEVLKDGKKIYKTLDETGNAIEFTFDEFEKGLSGTWLTRDLANAVYVFDDLSKASYQAARRCLTFKDVLEAWRDAVSTGWMANMQHIFGTLSDAINNFSAICDKAGSIFTDVFGKGGELDKELQIWEDIGGRTSLWSLILGEAEGPDGQKMYENAYGIIDIIMDISDMIHEAFWDVMKTFAEGFYTDEEMAQWDDPDTIGFRMQFIAYRIKDFTETVREYIDSIRTFFKTIPDGMNKSRWEIVKDVVRTILHVITFAAQVIGGLLHFFHLIADQLAPSFNAITGLFSDLLDGIIDTEVGLRRGKGITNFFEMLAEVMKPITAVINKVIVGVVGLIRSFIKWGKESGFFIDVWTKIKTAVKKTWDFVSGIITPIVGAIGGIIEAFKKLFDDGFSKENLAEFKENVKMVFSGMWEGIKDAIGPAVSSIGSFFSKIWAAIKLALADYFTEDKHPVAVKIINWVKNSFVSLKNGFSRVLPTATKSIGGFFTKVIDIVTSLFDGRVDILGSVKNIWKNVSTAITNFFSDGVLGTIKKIWETIRNFFTSLFGPKGGVQDTAESIETAADGAAEVVAGTVENVLTKPKSFGEAVMGAIHAVGEFLGKITTEQWIAIASAAAGIFLFIKIISYIRNVINTIDDFVESISNINPLNQTLKILNTFAVKVLALGVSIGIIALSMKMLGEMPVDKGVQGLVGIMAILIAMGAFMIFMKKQSKGDGLFGKEGIKGKEIVKAVFVMIGVAIAVGRMVKALQPLAEYNWEQLGKMGAGLVGIMWAMIGISAVVGHVKFDWKSGLGFVMFAWSIGILLKNLELILKYADTSKEENRRALIAMAATFAAIIAGFSILAANTKDNKGLLYAASLAAAIGILVLALTSVANMNLDQIGKMLGTLVVILFELWLFVKFFPKGGSIKDSGLWELLPMAAGIYLILKALMPVADMQPEQLLKMVGVLGGVILGLIGLIWAINKFEGEMDRNAENRRGLKKAGLGNIVFLALGIAALILALRPVADIGAKDDWTGIGKMLAVFVGIIVGISLLVTALNSAGDSEKGRGFKKTGIVVGLAAIVLSIAALIEILKPLAGMPWESIVQMFAPAILVILSISHLIKRAGEMKGDRQGLKSLLTMVGIVLVLQTIVAVVNRTKDVPTDRLLLIFGGITAVILALGYMIGKVANLSVHNAGNGFWKKIGYLAVAFVAVVGLAYIMTDLVKRMPDIDLGKMSSMALIIAEMMAIALIVTVMIAKTKASGADTGKKIAILATSVGLVVALMFAMVPLIDWAKNRKVDIMQMSSMAGIVAEMMAIASVVTFIIASTKVQDAENTNDKIKMLATSVALVAALMYAIIPIMAILSTAKTIDVDLVKMSKMAVVALELMAIATIVTFALAKIKTLNGNVEDKLKIFGVVMLALVVTFIAFGGMLTMIKNVDTTHIWTFMGAVSILFVVATAVAVLMTKITSNDGTAAKLGTFGEVLVALVAVIVLFGGMLYQVRAVSESKMWTFMGVVGILFTVASIMAVVMTKITSKDSTAAKLGIFGEVLGALIAVVVSFGIMLYQVKDVEERKMWTFMGAVSILFAIASAVSVGISLYKPANSGRITKFILFWEVLVALLGIIVIFGGVLYTIRSVKPETMKLFATVIGILFATVSLVAVLISKMEIPDSGKITKILLFFEVATALVVTMAVFGWMLNSVRGIDQGNMITFAACVGGLLIVALAVTYLLAKMEAPNKTEMKEKIANLALMVAGIVILMITLSATIGSVKEVKWDQIAAFAGGIAILMLSMAFAMKILNDSSKETSGGNWWKKLAVFVVGMIVVCGAMWALSEILPKVKEVDAGSTLALAVAIGILSIAMAASIQILSEVDLVKGIKAIVLLCVGLVALSVVFPLLVRAFSTAVVDVAEAMSDVSTELAFMSIEFGKVDVGNIMNVIPLISLLSETMLSFNGMAKLAADIKAFALGVWQLAVSLGDFYFLTKDIKTIENNGAIQLIEYFIYRRSELSSGMNMGEFPQTVANLGSGLYIFNELTKDIAVIDSNGAIQLIEYFIQRKDAINSINLGEVPTSIAVFGAGLWMFNDLTKDISGFSGGQKPASIQLIETLIDLSGNMGNLWDIYSFGFAVARLGTGIDSFFDDGGNALPANPDEDPKVKMLKALADSAPGIKTLKELDLEHFAETLSYLGGGMTIYALAAKEMANLRDPLGEVSGDGVDVSYAVEILKKVITELNELANEVGGEFNYPVLPEDEDSVSFGIKMASLAGGLTAFSNACNGINDSAIQRGLDAIRFLKGIDYELKTDTVDGQNALNAIGMFKNAEIDRGGISSFGLDLRELAKGLRQFINVSNGISDNTDKALDALWFLCDINHALTEDAINALKFFPGHQLGNTQIAALGTNLVTLSSGLKDFTGVYVNPQNMDRQITILDKLAEVNQKLTDNAIETIQFFPNHQIGNLQIGALGNNLVTLAEGLQKFVEVKVDESGLNLKIAFLNRMESLNKSLTNARIDEMSRTLAAYLTPIDTSKLSSGDYANYLQSAVASTNNQTAVSALDAFTYGITEIGGALKTFADETKDYFKPDQMAALRNAMDTVDFFQKQFNLMPKVDRSLVGKFLGYTQDLGDLTRPIMQLGTALSSFAEEVTKAYDDKKYNVEVVNAACDNIATFVSAYSSINETLADITNNIIGSYDNSKVPSVSEWAKELTQDATNLFDGGRAMRILTKQLYYVVQGMTDKSISFDGKTSVLDVYMDFVNQMNTKMDEFEVTKDDMERIALGLQSFKEVIGLFDLGEYQENRGITHFFNSFFGELNNALFDLKDSGEVGLSVEVDNIIGVLDSITQGIAAIYNYAGGYTSVGEDKIMSAVADYMTFFTVILDSVRKYFSDIHGADPDAFISIMSDWQQVADVIRNVAEAFSLVNSVPDITKALDEIGKSMAETIAEGLDNDGSISVIHNAISSLLSKVGKEIIVDPMAFIGIGNKGVSVTQKIANELSRSGKIMYNTMTDAFKNATSDDIRNAFADVVNDVDSAGMVTFEDVGVYMGLMVATGIERTKDAIAKSMQNVTTYVGQSMLQFLSGGQVEDLFAMSDILNSRFSALGKDLQTLTLDDFVEAYNSLKDSNGTFLGGFTQSFADIGYYMDIGLSAGIWSGSFLVENELAAVIAAARATAEEEAAIPYHITPIIDADKFDTSALDGLISSKISGNYTLTLQLDAGQLAMLTPRDYTANIEALATTVSNLQDDLSKLSNKLDRFDVVLDTGKMVGAFGPYIDFYLGSRGIEAGRGIYSGGKG